jgi:integrase
LREVGVAAEQHAAEAASKAHGQGSIHLGGGALVRGPVAGAVDQAKHLAGTGQRLRAGCSPRTVNHDVIVLKAVLNWAVRTAKLIASNPVKELKALRHDEPRQRRPFSLDEVNRLLEASPEPWRSIWYAFLVTGTRFEELPDLRFSDLEWENREGRGGGERGQEPQGAPHPAGRPVAHDPGGAAGGPEEPAVGVREGP